MRKIAKQLFNSMKDSGGKTKSFATFIHNALEQASMEVKVRDAKDDQPAELLLMGDIGDNWWGDSITAKEVVSFSQNNDGKDIRVLVDTPGGDVYDGMAIMNTLMQHNGYVTAEIIGLCYSAGSYAVLGCDKIKAFETTNYGIHPAWMYTVGNQYEHAESIAWLDVIDRTIMNVYVKRTGKSEEEIRDLFIGNAQDGTIFTAAEAKDAAFIDELIEMEQRTTAEDNDADEEESEDGSEPAETPEDSGGKEPRNESPQPRDTARSPEQDAKTVKDQLRQIGAKMRATRLKEAGDSLRKRRLDEIQKQLRTGR